MEEFITQPSAKVRIKILKDKCISAATCIIQAPNTFDLDEEGKVYTKETTWDEASSIYQAAMACPTTAIIIEDLEGNQLWPAF